MAILSSAVVSKLNVAKVLADAYEITATDSKGSGQHIDFHDPEGVVCRYLDIGWQLLGRQIPLRYDEPDVVINEYLASQLSRDTVRLDIHPASGGQQIRHSPASGDRRIRLVLATGGPRSSHSPSLGNGFAYPLPRNNEVIDGRNYSTSVPP